MNEAVNWQLINATLNGDSHRLQVLLSKRARFDIVQAYQLFHLAAASGSTENLKILLAFMPAINVNIRDEVGCTALHKAASAGHREVMHFLVYYGAKVDTQEYLHGNSPLHEAASKGYSRSVEALCILKASPNLQNKMGLTPLHVAAQHGHKQTLRVLLFYGADIGAVDQLGNTCLHTAIRYGRTGVVKILLAFSANVMAINHNLETPLHIAASLKRTKIARCLLKARESLSKVNGLTLRTSSPLSSTTSSSFMAAAQAALWMRNAQGELPLDVARRRVIGGCGSSSMVALLLEQMNDVQYENGTTKSLRRFSEGGSGSRPNSTDISAIPMATPYMSTDLIYSPAQKKKTIGAIKLPFKTPKIIKNRGLKAANCSVSSNNQIHPETNSPNPVLLVTPSVEMHRIPTEPGERMSMSFVNGMSGENPSYLSSSLKNKSRSIPWSPLGGFFKRNTTETNLAEPTGEMKKSESNFMHCPRNSQFSENNEVSTKRMHTSTSFSAALNESHAPSLTGKGVLKEGTLSTDYPIQQDILLGRFQRLPFSRNSGITSVGANDIHFEGPTANGSIGGVRDCNVAELHSTTVLHNQSTAVRANRESNERTRHRLGVRFDLDKNGVANAQNGVIGPTASHDRPHSMQFYRDLAGKLRKGPMGSSAGCDCVQLQANYLAGKTPVFVPCATHSYLECHVSTTDLRNPENRDTLRRRKHQDGGPSRVNRASNDMTKLWKRPHSDESLAVNAHVSAEIPTSVILVDTAPVTGTPVTSSGTTEMAARAIPISEAPIRNQNSEPFFMNSENASVRPATGHQVQKSNREALGMVSDQQKMLKSKSYHGQMANAIANKFVKLTKGKTLMNPKMAQQMSKVSPFYMSCRNVDGKMGLSVGLPSAGLFSCTTLMPTTDGAG